MTGTDAFEDLLTPGSLSALMRSTWTWDDRALRRDLATVLVSRDAARVAAGSDAAEHADTLRQRTLVSGADFVAAVLGPQLIADAGNPLRRGFLAVHWRWPTSRVARRWPSSVCANAQPHIRRATSPPTLRHNRRGCR